MSCEPAQVVYYKKKYPHNHFTPFEGKVTMKIYPGMYLLGALVGEPADWRAARRTSGAASS